MIFTFNLSPLTFHLFLPPSWPPICIPRHMTSDTGIKRFEDLIVWQKAMVLAEEVYRVKKRDKEKGSREKEMRSLVPFILYLVPWSKGS